MMVWSSLFSSLVSVALCLATATAHSQAATTYSEVFYPSSGVRIQAYVYKPDGGGPTQSWSLNAADTAVPTA